jgi:hypothetical protein
MPFEGEEESLGVNVKYIIGTACCPEIALGLFLPGIGFG